MSSSLRIEFSNAAIDEWDRQLASAEAIDRSGILSRAVREGLQLPARRLRQILPKPGYPGDKPGLEALRDKVRVKVKQYSRVTVGVLGYEHAGGQHGHLVDSGHEKVLWGRRTGGRVEGKKYQEKAVQETQDAMESKITDRITIHVMNILRG